MPSLHQREKRLKTLFQAPKRLGSIRHWAPMRSIHNTASTNRRQLGAFSSRAPFVVLSRVCICAQALSLSWFLSVMAKAKF